MIPIHLQINPRAIYYPYRIGAGWGVTEDVLLPTFQDSFFVLCREDERLIFIAVDTVLGSCFDIFSLVKMASRIEWENSFPAFLQASWLKRKPNLPSIIFSTSETGLLTNPFNRSERITWAFFARVAIPPHLSITLVFIRQRHLIYISIIIQLGIISCSAVIT